jgi:cytochrome P450
MGTSIMNYLPNQAAHDTYKYFLMAERKLLDRQTAEETAKANGKEARRDIFHYLFRSRDPVTGIELSKEQLLADAGLLIAAGSDGVSLTCAAAMFYLVRNPACLEKLTREIRSSFATLEDVRLPKLNQCTYLCAVVEEALRLAPCIASAFPREVLRGGLNVDGEHIPAGMTVGVSAYALHHNETYFPDSFAFKPERWLGDDASVAAARSAFCTFSVGPYNCIGKNVAYLACKLILAKLVYAYDVKAPEGNVVGGGGGDLEKGRQREGEFQMLDYLVAYRSGPMLQFEAMLL